MIILKADEVTVKKSENVLLDKISFTIKKGEQWAVTEPSGSGKTTLLKALCGRQFFTGSIIVYEDNEAAGTRMVMVEQQHHFKNLSNTNNFYYQQRFNSQDAEDAITVEEDLQIIISGNSGSAHPIPLLNLLQSALHL